MFANLAKKYNTSLKRQLADRDAIINKLTHVVDALKIIIYYLEQHSRKGSIRVFGLPEDTPGQVDENIVTLVNEHLKVRPPISLEDVEVAHRLGKPPEQTVVLESDQATSQSQSATRAIIVRFASWRFKSMEMKDKNEKESLYACQWHLSICLPDRWTHKKRAQLVGLPGWAA